MCDVLRPGTVLRRKTATHTVARSVMNSSAHLTRGHHIVLHDIIENTPLDDTKRSLTMLAPSGNIIIDIFSVPSHYARIFEEGSIYEVSGVRKFVPGTLVRRLTDYACYVAIRDGIICEVLR